MSKFQRRHYTAVAEILRDSATDSGYLFSREEVARIADQFARVFSADNSAFDRDRFLAAVGSSVHPSTSTRSRKA